ncbi:hypothetical protein [uncultured Bradyrhizobium sp.]|jgi:hypothetical protein|uniref:hypothetical protein n=1 Tax=uncultured Bradyrhizobium sp. TaxID=199684 RepID=UPI002629BE20|nr:hypothetical protein [uncultured Bradyrhizobium sp.]
MEANHTPGPWEAIPWECRAATTIVHKQSGRVIAECSGLGRMSDDCLDDARLIAAAPDMLRALEKSLQAMYERDLANDLDEGNRRSPEKIEDDGDWSEEVYAIRAAIAKATNAA